MTQEKICGTCRYHVHEDIDDGWICVNNRSDYCADWTEYNDSCTDWEERDGSFVGEMLSDWRMP